MKVGLVQTRTPASHAAAVAHVLPLVRQAAAGGARLIVTPEGTNILQKDREVLLPQLTLLADDPVVNGLRAAARELSVWIDVGSALVKREDGKAANRQVLIAPDGAIAATYDKLHMFDVDLPTGETARESATYEPGERAVTADVEGLKLGLTICYDLRFPQLYRRLAQAGAAFISVPAAFTRPTGEAHWRLLLQARAIETGCFVLAPAQCGEHAEGRKTWGHSLIVAPWGEVLAEAGEAPAIITARIDPAAVAAARAMVPALRHDRAFAPPDSPAAALPLAGE